MTRQEAGGAGLDAAARMIATDPDVNTAVVAGAYGMTKFLGRQIRTGGV